MDKLQIELASFALRSILPTHLFWKIGIEMSTRQIHVFISHAWKYSNNYETLAKWIFGMPSNSGQASFDIRDYSVPKDDPIHNATNEQQLDKAILKQIQMSHVVVIPTGLYASYSKWINKEIDWAKALGKPIIAVNLWGAERKSSVVLQNCDVEVGWNRQPLIDSIWKHYITNQ